MRHMIGISLNRQQEGLDWYCNELVLSSLLTLAPWMLFQYDLFAGPGEMKADSGTWHIQNLYLWDPVWGTCIHHFRNPCPSTEQSPGPKLPVPKRVILLIKCGFDREEGEETRKPRRAVMYAGLKHTEDSSHPGTKASDTMDGLVSWVAKAPRTTISHLCDSICLSGSLASSLTTQKPFSAQKPESSL
ncbi:uncharacterized protein LOC131492922 isoform X2 [Neofelis nebulosa]|uniref:uncharacterized protein LOC131492922 isoform X2 n=1 Tax=Neofelis nebulosa TaxID=61452 RepID=UPI002729AD33|nr:uncharacterized protein LOC131492922 isoform X2 [Neofelis nebulosa]